MAQVVAVDLDNNGEFVAATLVKVSGGWTTIEVNGEQRKVRNKQVAMNDEDEPIEELMTDDDLDDDEEPSTRDVFPEGIRETYQKEKVMVGDKVKVAIDCGDEVAELLRSMSLVEVANVAQQVLGQRTAAGWLSYYREDRLLDGKKPLNDGMVRMNLGNRIRSTLKAQQEEAAEA